MRRRPPKTEAPAPGVLLIALVTGALILVGAVPCFPAGEGEKPFLWGFALDGYPITQQRLNEVERETGIRSDVTLFFLQWPSPEDARAGGFPVESLDAIWGRGGLPCITWEPMYYRDGRETAIPHALISGGGYDAYIRAFAQGAKSWGKPLMIRFAHEMNIKRYHWGTDEKEYGPGSPAVYRLMFQYVVSVFRQEGAGNVLWVFCPNAESLPQPGRDGKAGWNTIRNYYPGDSYVDVLGVDGYNWGTTQTVDRHGWNSKWRSFEELLGPARKELLSLSPGKDILVFETATVAEGGDKAAWIRDALRTAEKWKLRGIIWFHQAKEQDWRIGSGVDRSYANMVRQETSPSQRWARKILKGQGE